MILKFLFHAALNCSKSSEDLSLILGQLRKSSEDFGNLLPFFRCKVKVNVGNSKSIWGHGGRFDGEEVSCPFSWGGGWGSLIPGSMKEKSPDFRSPEVVISEDMVRKVQRIPGDGNNV